MDQESSSNFNNNSNTHQSIEPAISDLHIQSLEENMVLDSANESFHFIILYQMIPIKKMRGV